MDNNIKSINDIFNEMTLEDKKSHPSDLKSCKFKILENEGFRIVLSRSLSDAFDAASKSQKQWASETCLNRSMKLHRVSRHLVRNWGTYTKNQLFSESEYSLVVSFLDTYSDFALSLEELSQWKPLGVVYLKLNVNTPLVFVAATIASAVAAGCCVIVHGSLDDSWFPLFLAHIFILAGLPENLITVVVKPDEKVSNLDNLQNVVFYGSYKEAQDFYINCQSKSFRFFCPNNTSSIILESCDINAAVDKIFSETWGCNSSNLWGVSSVVVQESMFNEFLEKLKTCVNHSSYVKSQEKDEVIMEKINKLLAEATKKGASVIKKSDKEWGPIAVVNYQDQNVDLDVPVLKIMVCRTPAEGVALLNNLKFCLGTSVWCENMSRAMEVASKLNCKNIWLNCHGVVEAGVPIQPIGCSGDYAFNGKEGLMEFITFENADSSGGKFFLEDFNVVQQINVWTTISAAQSSFTKWQSEKNKRKYLIDAAFEIEKAKEYQKSSNLSEIFKHHAYLTNISDTLGKQNSEQFCVVYKKEPVGVIAIVINSSTPDANTILSFITQVIAFGNTVILVLQENKSFHTLRSLTNSFKDVLPNNVLNIIVGLQAVTELASSSVVQALWFYDECLSSEYLQKIRNQAAHNLKNIWMIPKDISKSEQIIRKQCTRSKVIWLTKIDQFP